MQNKLQELTDKLYNEGLSKGKQEADNIINNAKAEADKILSDAKEEAKKINAKAEKDAAELRTRIENDIKMASTQIFASIRQQIESMITLKVVADPVKDALSGKNIMEKVIETITGAFKANSAEPVSLSLILPESLKNELGSYTGKAMSEQMTAGVDLSFSKDFNKGFKIGPKEGGYIISFTDEDFEGMISEYLRPATKKLLFG